MTPRAILGAFGHDWLISRPRASSALIDGPGATLGLGYVIDFITAHVVDEQREEFVLAMEACEELGPEDLHEIMGLIADMVYDGLPFPALLALWSRWPDRRHEVHARLLSAGHVGGSDGLDLYDVAMLCYADIEREWGLDHPMADPAKVKEGRQELRRLLRGDKGTPDAAVSELEEIRAALGPKRPQGPGSAVSGDAVADLDEIRERLRPASDD